jgi:antitoxin CcdA
MKPLFDPHAPRRAVNLSLNADLVEKARAHKLNLSAIAEAAISRALAEAAEAWFREEIAHSVAEHAEYLATYGSLGDALRAMKSDDAA